MRARPLDAQRTISEAFDAFLGAPAIRGPFCNGELIVQVLGTRGAAAMEAARFDAVSLKYERPICTFAEAFRACARSRGDGRMSWRRFDLATLRECDGFAALGLPVDVEEAIELEACAAHWARVPSTEEETMRRDTATGATMCDKCGLIGAPIRDGKIQPHKDVKGAECCKAGPPAFLPRCSNGTQDFACDCRAHRIGRAMVAAFGMAGTSPTEIAAAPIAPIVVRFVSDARPAARPAPMPRARPVARVSAPAPAPPARAPIAAQKPAPCAVAPSQLMSGAELLAACVKVGTGIVGAFEALRETAHRAQLDDLTARIDAAIARQAAHGRQIAQLAAPDELAARAPRLAIVKPARARRLAWVTRCTNAECCTAGIETEHAYQPDAIDLVCDECGEPLTVGKDEIAA